MGVSARRSPGPALGRFLDLIFVAFFAIHVPITLFLDSQVLFPPSLFPKSLQNAIGWYVHLSGDHLVKDKPPFFRGLVLAEILLQLPLTIANACAFSCGKHWGKTTGLIYGVHTATTMVPILADIVLASNVASKTNLLMIYVPYMIIPLVLVARVLIWPLPTQQPSPLKEKKKN